MSETAEEKKKEIDPELERKLFDIMTVFIVVLSLVIRLFGFKFVSADYNIFLKNWYEEIKALGGLRALGQQVGDYNLTYQTFIALFSYTDIYPLYCYKILSVVFDYLLAIGAYKLISLVRADIDAPKRRMIVAASALLLPSVVLNSSYWGQCDVIFVCFIVWALCYLLQDKFTKAFIFLGLSFAFKLQVVFILPFVVYYCWYKKKIELTKLTFLPAIGFLMSVPAIFMGRRWYDFVMVYVAQGDNYRYMSLNAPNLWGISFFGYDSTKYLAILLTFALLGLVLLFVMLGKIDLSVPHIFIGVASWSAWTCVMFLPGMHERYFFIVDILLMIAAVIAPKKYLWICIAEELVSLLATYLRCLFFAPIGLKPMSWANLIIYGAFTVVMVIVVVRGKDEDINEGEITAEVCDQSSLS